MSEAVESTDVQSIRVAHRSFLFPLRVIVFAGSIFAVPPEIGFTLQWPEEKFRQYAKLRGWHLTEDHPEQEEEPLRGFTKHSNADYEFLAALQGAMREVVLASGLSHSEFAARLGVRSESLNRMLREGNFPNVSTLMRFAETGSKRLVVRFE
jgi:transcriptional regulator with XRE-family HTH domain